LTLPVTTCEPVLRSRSQIFKVKVNAMQEMCHNILTEGRTDFKVGRSMEPVECHGVDDNRSKSRSSHD